MTLAWQHRVLAAAFIVVVALLMFTGRNSASNSADTPDDYAIVPTTWVGKVTDTWIQYVEYGTIPGHRASSTDLSIALDYGVIP